MKPAAENDNKYAERMAYLIAGHLHGTLTEEESNELDEWITGSDENLELFEKLTDEENIENALQQYLQQEKEKTAAFSRVKKSIYSGEKKPALRGLLPYLVAASLLLIAATFYLFNNFSKPITGKNKIANLKSPVDVKPGSDKAVLTLSGGRTIILDANGTGLLANEGPIIINKSADEELVYKGTANDMRYNTVSTPRGGQFKLLLADGTRLWLNAESSIKFPASFGNADRVVELKGEAYFEVAKDAAHPFRVKTTTPTGLNATIEVLGTHFNVNAYGDDNNIRATLVEGSVVVTTSTQKNQLRPGEEATINNKIAITQINPELALAWKEGKFLFRNASIYAIGQQIKRWYDIDVEYKGNINQAFNTEVSRNVPLSKLLDGLEGTGQVHFKLQNNKLIISP
jgi:transmembrane sensor